ncbi:MAG: hypothetical protein ACRDQV_14180 [Pseudonocardiaceae bacterium]
MSTTWKRPVRATLLWRNASSLSISPSSQRHVVALGAHSITIASGAAHSVPEYAQALLHGWPGRYLLSQE